MFGGPSLREAMSNAAKISTQNTASVFLRIVEHRGKLDRGVRAAIRSTPGHISGE